MRRARAACGPCAAEGASVNKELSKRSEVVVASERTFGPKLLMAAQRTRRVDVGSIRPAGLRVPHFSTQFVGFRTDRRARSPFLNPVRRPPY